MKLSKLTAALLSIAALTACGPDSSVNLAGNGDDRETPVDPVDPVDPIDPVDKQCVVTPTEELYAAPYQSAGRWITDANGHVNIFHGVNLVSKYDPWLPTHAGLSEDDAEFLNNNGFNNLRLGFNWAAIEPNMGEYNLHYVRDMLESYRILSDAGITVQIDMHQDMYSSKYQGNGHPEWSAQDDGLPAEPQRGFPQNYVVMPALGRAYDNFWLNRAAADGKGLQDHYAEAWRLVVEVFKDEPYMLGYNLMNEPFPGSTWQTCAQPAGCPVQDAQLLAAFHQRVTDVIRTVDTEAMIWYEPWLLFDFGADSHHPALDDNNTGFAFHNYCLGGSGAFSIPGTPSEACALGEDIVFQNADRQADETNSALMMGEFGASNNYAEIKRVTDGADDYMMSWQYWHYCSSCVAAAIIDPNHPVDASNDNVIAVDINRPLTGSNVDQKKLDVLSRPYPQSIAGTPLEWNFDADSKTFTFSYTTIKANGEGRFDGNGNTVIYVPERHYPNGYSVEVNGAHALPNETNKQRLDIGCAETDEISVTIRAK